MLVEASQRVRGVDPSGNDIVALDRLGEPHPCGGFFDFLEAGYLLLEIDSQYCCQWMIKLQLPVPTGMDPLFDLPMNLPAADDDPPVYLIPPGRPDSPHRVVYAERFSSYVWTQVWDRCIAADFPYLYDDDVPARPDVLATLRGRFAELPPTHGWAGNQPCDTVHRFGRDGTRVEIAVRGEREMSQTTSHRGTAYRSRDGQETSTGAVPKVAKLTAQ